MKKLFLKSFIYIFLILVSLEFLVRIFHLHTEVPVRFIDGFGVEKSIPKQTGFAVTGNRRQNFSEYRINNSGFNSFREFNPTKDKTEIAIIGDSFIEGMHQDYYDSTGKKIEEKLNNVEVYEYGYAGYDLANQLYLINAYKEKFDMIDHIIIYLKYENDLQNATYKPNHDRISLLKSPLFRIRDEFKLLSYASANGIVDPIKNLAIKILKGKETIKTDDKSIGEEEEIKNLEYLKNFKNLIETYGFNKQKISFLLNSKTTSPIFLDYCNENGYQIIDFAYAFEKTKEPPTLVYDMHWNSHGRELIATVIANYLRIQINRNE